MNFSLVQINSFQNFCFLIILYPNIEIDSFITKKKTVKVSKTFEKIAFCVFLREQNFQFIPKMITSNALVKTDIELQIGIIFHTSNCSFSHISANNTKIIFAVTEIIILICIMSFISPIFSIILLKYLKMFLGLLVSTLNDLNQ